MTGDERGRPAGLQQIPESARASAAAHATGADALATLVTALANALAPMVAELVAARLVAPPQAPVDPDRLLCKAELARKLSVSVATLDRLTREGLPIAAHVGDSRRYALQACRDWLAVRGKRPTKALAKTSDDDLETDADVRELARRAGLVAPKATATEADAQ